MQFVNQGAELYIPDGKPEVEALNRTTHLAIGAHQDDLEIFAMHGIGACCGKEDKWFTGVTVTNGSGSSRKGKYADKTDADMMEIRHGEQNAAAKEGQYAAQYQLNYKSSDIKGANPPKYEELVQEIREILVQTHPQTLYVHNPFDKHETHNAVTRATIDALRTLPALERPREIYGVEVWRGLDWVPDKMKVSLDVSAYTELQRKLIDAHDSQIAGSKGYTEATLGREKANATYLDSHALDNATAVNYAVDLAPLVNTPGMTMQEFTKQYVGEFTAQLMGRARDYEMKRTGAAI
jgi:LmbE family N-acetylglucosaminyl deacetylase